MRLQPGTLELTIALAEARAPTEFRIFAPGSNRSSKGDFLFDKDSATSVLEDAAVRGRARLPFDWEHKMFDDKASPSEKKAAGWFSLEVRETPQGPELWATDIEWTPTAKAEIENRERGYFSPTFAADSKTGRVLRLANIALTNTPALFGIPLLFEASDFLLGTPEQTSDTPEAAGLTDTTQEQASMAEENSMKGLIALLKLSEGAGEAEVMGVVTRLTDERNVLLSAVGVDNIEAAKGRIQALKSAETKLSETEAVVVKLSGEIRDRDKSALLKQNEAKFTPAELDGWVKGASLEMLTEYVKTAPDRVKLGDHGPAQPAVTNVQLTDAERRIAKAAGMTEEAFAAHKALLEKEGAE